MASSTKRRKRARGRIEELPSGSLRVQVYAGIDPVTGRRHYLRETIPAGPQAVDQAEKALTRLQHEINERRNPKTSATVEELIKRYLDKHFTGEPSSRADYRLYARRHVLPSIGKTKVGQLDAYALDSLYAELRECRDHCRRYRKKIDHRTPRAHECDERCRPHSCKPMSAAAIRRVHSLLSGAFDRAVKWKWVAVNPARQADPPSAPPARPAPPTSDQALRILNTAWGDDEDWGALVWVAMTTGARRGEVCALCWSDVDLASGVLSVRRAVALNRENRSWYLKDTKTHQQRRVAIDPETVRVLQELRDRQQKRAAELGLEIAHDAYLFSPEPDGSHFPLPDSVSQRYDRMVDRLGIDTTLHKLRHYSATELISAGVDPRTVAGRLGHSGGGTTTLKVYTAWVSEADQRASSTLASRLPQRPQLLSPAERVKANPTSPYQKLAVELAAQIEVGDVQVGDDLPSLKQLSQEYDVSVGTAHRAIELLKEWGLVTGSRGRRITVIACPDVRAEPVETQDSTPEPVTPAVSQLLSFEVRRLGESVRSFTAEADPGSAQQLRALLAASVRRDGRDTAEILDYELEVRRPTGEHVTTFVTMTA